MLFNLKLIFMKKPIKFCKNPDCEEEILDCKSSKKIYCTDKCRNYHGHKRRSEENLEFNESNGPKQTNHFSTRFSLQN